MNLSSTYRKQEDIVTRQIAGETLLVPIRSNLADMQKIYGLNPLGDYIWQQLDGKRSLTEILAEVAGNFDVTEEQAEIDIREFISQLTEAGIIEEAALPGAGAGIEKKEA
jgi:hypothetical protein